MSGADVVLEGGEGDKPFRLPDEVAEATAFRRCRWRVWRASLVQLLHDSFLRLLLIIVLTIAFWAVMFGLFHEGFSLLRTAIAHPPTLARTVHAVYNMFFLSLLIMLGISSGILYYAAVFRSPEVNLLLTLPVRTSRIALEKLMDAALLACWGFVLLGSPLLVAYGIVNQAPAAYFVLLLPLLVTFAIIPSALGALACLLLVSLAPKWRRALLTLLGLVLLLGFLYLVSLVFQVSGAETMSALWLQKMLDRLRLAEQRLLPSWWLSTALLEAAHGGPHGVLQALGFQCVLLSNALLLPRVIAAVGDRLLRRSYGQFSGGYGIRWNVSFDWMDQLASLLLRPLAPETRLLLLKDLRLFRRDPLQWSQFLLFFGLLSFYFFYVRRFDYGAQLTGWMTAIGYMNLGVVGLILSTFTTRFVFPLVSMEGQRFWILGTAPIDRRRILWSKFLFATIVTGVPCCVLVFLSDIALQLMARTPAMVWAHQGLCVLMAVGLSALSVGLGARLPNLREPSPAKIAAGFGGTLTLIISALYVLALIIPPAIPAYLMYAHAQLAVVPGTAKWDSEFWFVAMYGLAVVVAVGAAGTSLRIGMRAFVRLEA